MKTESAIQLAQTALQKLFKKSSPEAITSLATQATLRSLDEGAVLMAEGDQADEVFILSEGRLKVYVHDAQGRWAALASIHQHGQWIGEQAFTHPRRFRNATVVALTPSRLVALPGSGFRVLLSNDADALMSLKGIGSVQLLDRLRLISDELAAWSRNHEIKSSATVQLAEGETLFRAGEKAGKAYVVLSGEIALYPRDSRIARETIGPGLVIGVNELVEQGTHPLTATAVTSSELLTLDHATLQELRARPGALGTDLQSLAGARNIVGLGMAYRYVARVDGASCLVTDFRQPDGRAVRVRHFPVTGRTEAACSTASHENVNAIFSPDGQSMLLVNPEGGPLMGLSASHDWRELAKAMGLLLRGEDVKPLQIDAFRASGELLLEDAAYRATGGAEIVCACTHTTAAQLRAVARQCQRVDDLCRLTGAGTVCGGCRDRLPVFLGGYEQSTLCRLDVQPLAEGSVCVNLIPLPPAKLRPAKPGQHINVEALVDGHWVGRPYTLVDSSPGAYELGVKIESQGFFSNWINAAREGVLVRVGEPEGVICPAANDPRPLVYIVAGIGITPAIAGLRQLTSQRKITIVYTYRGASNAAYLDELKSSAAAGRVELLLHDSAAANARLSVDDVMALPALNGAAEIILCGPGPFNRQFRDALSRRSDWEVKAEGFDHPHRGEGPVAAPRSWRIPGFKPACPAGPPMEVDAPVVPLEEAVHFTRAYHIESGTPADAPLRIEQIREEMDRTGSWTMTADELGFATRIAWRNAERCVGRLYWKGLHLRDNRSLRTPREMADATFDHLRFAFNGGDLRPCISVFDPGNRERPAPRIWNPQLLRYAGMRLRSGRQIGDPAQNELTKRIMALGWEPDGSDFCLLPLVIETAEHGAQWFPLPPDCRQEVLIRHADYPGLEALGLRWHAIPAVSDMALDAGGIRYSYAPFNGWYLNTEIAARNFTDTNRYNLLPRFAELMGLDFSDDRSLWRDKALIMINEALIQSFDRARVKLSDHHTIGHEFLEFCRSEQRAGREPYGNWTWLVPPVSASTSVLYQEPFENRAIKPAYIPQPPVWKNRPMPAESARQSAAVN